MENTEVTDRIGNVSLIRGDCMDALKRMPDLSFDIAIVDPPYGGANCLGIGGGKRFGGRFDRYKEPFRESCRPSAVGSVGRTGGQWAAKYGKGIIGWDVAPKQEYFDELFRVSKNQIIWGGNYFSLPPTRCFIVWRKLTISEKFTMAMAEYAWTSFAQNAKVFECAPQGTQKDPRFHPTQKPVKLYKWLLEHYAEPGMKILDTHMGSGSSAVAALDYPCDYLGIEINSEYYEKAAARIRRAYVNRQPRLDL